MEEEKEMEKMQKKTEEKREGEEESRTKKFRRGGTRHNRKITQIGKPSENSRPRFHRYFAYYTATSQRESASERERGGRKVGRERELFGRETYIYIQRERERENRERRREK